MLANTFKVKLAVTINRNHHKKSKAWFLQSSLVMLLHPLHTRHRTCEDVED